MIFIQLRPYIMYKRNIFRASALVLLYLHVFKKSVQRKTTVLISVDHMILKLSFFAEFFLLLVACACCNSNLVFALAKRNDKLFAKRSKGGVCRVFLFLPALGKLMA